MSRGTPRRRGGAPAEQYVGHLLELFCIVPLAVCGMNAAEKQVTDVEAIDGPDQRLEIDVLPQRAVGLELSDGREHWVPEMPAWLAESRRKNKNSAVQKEGRS
jgi:hypothetical protein